MTSDLFDLLMPMLAKGGRTDIIERSLASLPRSQVVYFLRERWDFLLSASGFAGFGPDVLAGGEAFRRTRVIFVFIILSSSLATTLDLDWNLRRVGRVLLPRFLLILLRWYRRTTTPVCSRVVENVIKEHQ